MENHIFPIALTDIYSMNVMVGAIFFVSGIIAITEGYEKRVFDKRFMFWA